MKNFKTVVAVILLTAMVFSAIGCHQNASSVEESTGVPMTASVQKVTPTAEPISSATAPTTFPPTKDDDPWAHDPWENLVTTDTNLEGIFWVRRGSEKRHMLSRSIPHVPGKEYDRGRIDKINKEVVFYDFLPKVAFYDFLPNAKGVMTCGDVWIPLLEKGDQLIGVFSQDTPDVFLAPLDFYGHGVGLRYLEEQPGSDAGIMFLGDEKKARGGISFGKVTNFQVTDTTGDPLKNWYDAVFEKEYIVSWYEGTVYYEERMLANNSFFVYADSNISREKDIARSSYSIKIVGELTKNGYAIYDFSDVPSGVYQIYTNSSVYPIYGYGLIEID